MKKIIFVIPAYNEEEVLEENIKKLNLFLQKNLKNYNWRIIISNNHSADSTLKIAKSLSKNNKRISYYSMKDRPKSLSIKKIWMVEDADFYAYMDADLSTDIEHIPQLINELEKGYDLVTGSRVSKESKSKRTVLRTVISWGLISIIKLIFWTNLEDFQCGFKAINKKFRDNIIPKMQCLKVGFMDTEMIAVASSKNYRIKSIPVFWSDTRKSKSPIFKGIVDALINVFKIKFRILLGRY